jgi:dihydrodipicolinate synthase/N-acetylneuraminate lyase
MPQPWNRREFIKRGALGCLCGFLSRPAWTRGRLGSGGPAAFYRRLRGPIVSIPTPFGPDFNLDARGLRNIVDMDLDQGITTFELTAGDSQYVYLSYEEIKELARLLTLAVGSRGMTIIGTGPWWLERAMEFAKYAESIGATALQVLKPPGAAGDDLIMFYRRLAQSTSLPIVLHGNFPMETLARLAEIDSIVALKEDVSLEYYIDGMIRFGHRFNCFSGGGLDWFLVGQPYGATAYFDSYATFAPEIAVKFWEAVQRSDYAAEVEIIEKYDHPFIQNFSAPFWHATLEYFGVARRYVRPPQHTYTDAEMAQVKSFYDKLGVFPKKPPF